MQPSRIVVATDESEQSRQAVRVGRDLARRRPARISVIRVVPRVQAGAADQVELGRLRSWLEGDAVEPEARGSFEVAVAQGIPSIEIARHAENRHADLLILGRKSRSQAARLLVGDTADAVARRSRVPCMFVPPGVGTRSLRRMLVALDGSARGMVVLRQACGFARAWHMALGIVTIEPGLPGDRRQVDEPPLASTQRLASEAREIAERELGASWPVSFAVRRGTPVDEILAAIAAHRADVLAIGFHRGGPPGVMEAGSTARRLLHLAQCAVLTVPL
jgi:nucleotide-binding universal stress UspA family protein